MLVTLPAGDLATESQCSRCHPHVCCSAITLAAVKKTSAPLFFQNGRISFECTILAGARLWPNISKSLRVFQMYGPPALCCSEPAHADAGCCSPSAVLLLLADLGACVCAGMTPVLMQQTGWERQFGFRQLSPDTVCSQFATLPYIPEWGSTTVQYY